MLGKKAALILYPMFCNWEIALTIATLNAHEKEVVSFAVDRNPVRCEEGMTIMPDKTFDEFDIGEYDCVLLTGIGGNPDAILYSPIYADFLRQFAGRDDYLIAAISLSPVLLGKAGLLGEKRFCVGMYEEDRQELSAFLDYAYLQRAPIIVDGNVITAMGMAFREFAIAVARGLGYECKDKLWAPIEYPIEPNDYIFRITPSQN